MEPGLVGIGGQEEPHIARRGPEGQDDLIPAGLIDLVHLGPGQGGIQFMDHAGQAQSVQGHRITSGSEWRVESEELRVKSGDKIRNEELGIRN